MKGNYLKFALIGLMCYAVGAVAESAGAKFDNKDSLQEQLLSYARYCSTPELANTWKGFIAALDALPLQEGFLTPDKVNDSVRAFAALMNDLASSNNISLWFDTCFYQMVYGVDSYEIILDHFLGLTDFNKKRQYLGMFVVCQKEIAQLAARQANGFANADDVQRQWKYLKERVIIPLSEDPFITYYFRGYSVLAPIVHVTMKQAVDIIAATIQELRTNDRVPMSQRVAIFKDMVGDFNQLVLRWEILVSYPRILPYHDKWTPSYRVYALGSFYNKIAATSNSAAMLQRSPKFAVSAAMLGSTAALDHYPPQSLEDMFMLIHQNALVIIAARARDSISTGRYHWDRVELNRKVYLPPLLKACWQNLEQDKIGLHQQLLGFLYSSADIQLLYTLNSAHIGRRPKGMLQLIYNRNTNTCSCNIQIMSRNRNLSHGDQVAMLARISPALSGLQLLHDVQWDTKAREVSWSWSIKSENDLLIMKKYLRLMQKELFFDEYFELDDLYSLYNGEASPVVAVKGILKDYIKKFSCATWSLAYRIRFLLRRMKE